MKRFILFFFMLLCTLTSAVAESTAFGTDNLSSYEVDGTTVTVTIGTAGDLSTLVSTTWNSGSATPSEVASSTKVIISGPINSSDAGVLYAFTGATTYDLRNATFGENVGSSIVVENSKSNVIVIVPGGTTTTVLATYNASNIGLYASYSNGNKDLSVYFPTTITAETAALINSSIKSDVENLNIEGDVRANITIDVSGLEYVNLIHITDSYNTAYSITLSGSATNVIASNGGIHTYWEDSKQISAPYITYTAAQVKNLIVIDTTNHQVTATIANDGNLSEALQLVDMLAVTSLTVVGKATTTDAANLATLAPALERLDLKQADVTATEFNALNVPATLKSMVVPAGTTMTTSFKSLLQSNFSQLDYVYSPSTDQTTTDVPDIVFVCQAGGLKEAFDNESGVKTALYLKVDSYTELNQADLTLNSYSPKKYEYLEFTDAKLSKTTVSDLATSASSNLYRVILPEGWTGEDMATFNGVSTSPSDYRLAAYYSYSGNAPYRTLNILGLSNSYSTTALTNTPMIKDGIFAVNFVSGEYNSNTYGTFTDNMRQAINSADSRIKSVTISAAGVYILSSSAKIENTHITHFSLAGNHAATTSTDLDLTGCTSLVSVDLSDITTAGNANSGLQSVDVHGLGSLTALNLSGTKVANTVNVSSTAITATDADGLNLAGATIKDINASSTNLSYFTVSSATTITGTIDLKNNTQLASVNISSLPQVSSNSYNGVVLDVRKSDSEDATNGNMTGSLAQASVLVPQNFVSDQGVVKPSATTNYTEKEATPDPYVFSTSYMTYHEADGDDKASDTNYDPLAYWYNVAGKTNKNVTLNAGGSLSANYTSATAKHTAPYDIVKVTGELSSDDVNELANIDAVAIDLSDATFATDVTLNAMSSNNTKVHFVVMPTASERDGDNGLNAETFTHFTNLYSAVAIKKEGTRRSSVSYTRVAGTLQPAVVATGLGTSGGSTITTKEDREAYYPTMNTSDGTQLVSVTLAGNLNAYDVSTSVNGIKVNAGGHFVWDTTCDETADSDNRTLNGAYTIMGAFSGSYNIEEIDMEKAVFATNTDMTLSTSGSHLINAQTWKVILPTAATMTELPAYFCTDNGVKELCIPANYKIIRTHIAPSLDHVWTTKGTADGEDAKVDNGVCWDGTNLTEGYHKGDMSLGEYEAHWSKTYYGTYTLSSNVKLIESKAFSNTTPHIKDVYVLALQAPECHVDAFNTAMYQGNSGFSGAPVNGIVTREAYYNGSTWITMLHYPRNCDAPEIQRYTDMGRHYSIATGDIDGKGAPIYYPTYSEFLRAYLQGTYGYLWKAWDLTYAYGQLANNPAITTNSGWTAEYQYEANAAWASNYETNATTDVANAVFYDVALSDGTTTNSKPAGLADYWDVTYGATVLYPQAEQRSTGTTGGLAVTGTDSNSDGMITSRDFRGWHQFVLTSFAANTTREVTQHRSYATDNDWWTICLPYDLRYSDMMFFYGGNEATAVPYLSQLVSVIRDESTETITLNFSENLMDHSQTQDENGNWIIGTETDATIQSANKVVLHAGVPYMIRPNRTMVDGNYITQFDVYMEGDVDNTFSNGRKTIVDETLYATLNTAAALSGEDQMALVENGLVTVPAYVNSDSREKSETSATIGSDTYYVSDAWDYTFVGSFYKSFIPPYSYFLGYSGKARFFYASTPRTVSYLDDSVTAKYPDLYNTMLWNNNTCIIMPDMLTSGVTRTINSTAKSFPYNLGKGAHNGKVTRASGSGSTLKPAQWLIGVNGTETTSHTDDLPSASAKNFGMIFGVEQATTAIKDVTTDSMINASTHNKVFHINGQYVGNDLHHLPAGIYIQNGKKVVVK